MEEVINYVSYRWSAVTVLEESEEYVGVVNGAPNPRMPIQAMRTHLSETILNELIEETIRRHQQEPSYVVNSQEEHAANNLFIVRKLVCTYDRSIERASKPMRDATQPRTRYFQRVDLIDMPVS
jgi:hypothetical protein